MSRVGKLPIVLPAGVSIDINGLDVSVSSMKGSLKKSFSGNINISIDDGFLKVTPLDKAKFTLAMWGTTRSIINNMIVGLSNGFKEELEIFGVGYRALVKDKYLNLSVGKSHPVKILIPEYIKLEVTKQNTVILESIDKEALGQFMSIVTKECPTEPYKGKGIRIKGSYFAKKEVVKKSAKK